MEGAVTGGGTAAAGGEFPARQQALRPLGVGETLDVAISLYRNNAPALWRIVALVIIPIEAVEVVLRRISLPSGVFVHDGSLYVFSVNGSNGTSSVVPLLLVALLGFLGQLVSNGAVFKLLIDHYLGRSTSWRDSFEFALSRLGSLLWLAILTVVLVSVGFVLLIIPGIWLIVSISVAVPALMLEGVGGFAAMKRSIDLVDGRWWATLLRLLAALLLYAVVSIVIGAIVSGLTSALSVSNVTLWEVIYGILRAALVIVMTPFIAAVITVVYVDLRVRKEALDLELLATGLGAPGANRGQTVAASDPTSIPPPSEPTWPPAE